MAPRLYRATTSPKRAASVSHAIAAVCLPPLRWLRDAVGLLSGAALLAWLVVHFAR